MPPKRKQAEADLASKSEGKNAKPKEPERELAFWEQHREFIPEICTVNENNTISSEKDSPAKRHFLKLEEYMASQKIGSYTMVRYIRQKEEDEENEKDEEGDPLEKFSEEDVAQVRVVLLPLDRKKIYEDLCEKIEREIAGLHDGVVVLNTSASYPVAENLEAVLNMAAHKKPALKFDLLLSITLFLKTYDFWYSDTDMPDLEAELVRRLARTWKALLKKSNEELGIDAEYTRPGVAALLEDFAEDMKEASDRNLENFAFKWRPAGM